MRTLCLLSLLLVLAAPAARAQAAPSASHVQAAEAVLEVMQMERMLRESSEAMLRTQAEQNPMLAQFDDITREFMERHLRWEELRPEYVRIYTELFTEAELRELHAFYRTPLGRRILETTPEMTLRTASISQRRLQEHMPELMQRMMERMAESGGPGGR